jgi:hypothetical protein
MIRSLIGILLSIVVTLLSYLIHSIWISFITLPFINILFDHDWINLIKAYIDQLFNIQPELSKTDLMNEINKLRLENESVKERNIEYKNKMTQFIRKINRLESQFVKIEWYNEINISNWDWRIKIMIGAIIVVFGQEMCK